MAKCRYVPRIRHSMPILTREGEIDIIEYTNNLANNLMALHTSDTLQNCTVAGSGQTGTLLTNDCGVSNSRL
jgi:hypothetical protein